MSACGCGQARSASLEQLDAPPEATGDGGQVGPRRHHASVLLHFYLRTDPASKLETLAARQQPVIRRCSFEGVRDDLLAMLSGLPKPPGG